MLVSWKLFQQIWKRLRDAVDNEVVKNIKSITLKAKVNNFDKKIADATT